MAAFASQPDQAEIRRRTRERWRLNSVAFGQEALGVALWSKQQEILQCLHRRPRVAVRSGHKCGKTNSLVVAALWFCLTKPHAQVVLIAPTARQVREVLWRELRLRHSQARFPIGGKLNESPAAGFRLPDGRQIVGLSTKDAEKIAGISGANVLFVVDEASGVPDKIFEAIEGNRAGGAWFLMASNPTQTSGEFFEAFHKKSHLYERVHMSSRHVPNVTGIGTSIRGLATPGWVTEKLDEWGEDSPLFQVRVEGQFPVAGDGRIIPLQLVSLAHVFYDETLAEGRLELGLDPARDGDDESVLVIRRGKKVLAILAWRGLDGPQLAGHVLKAIRQYRRVSDGPALVKIDPIGVGASPYDCLLAMARDHESTKVRFQVIEVKASSTADRADEYGNMRAQLVFGVRDWLRDGGVLPEDDRLDQELIQPRSLFDNRGRLIVESKDTIKAELKRSPDRADALALAVYEGGNPAEHLLRDEYDRMLPAPRDISGESGAGTYRRPDHDDDIEAEEKFGWEL